MLKAPLDDLAAAYRILNPGPVLVISVGVGDRDNLFAVTWNMVVRKDPPMMALLSGKGHHSWPFIESTGQFAANVLHADHADAILGTGSYSGARVDAKWSIVGLTRRPATKIAAPLVAESVASLECEVEQIVDLDRSALVVARIVAAQVDTDHFQGGHWTFDKGLQIPHHLSGSGFCVSGEVVKAVKPAKPQG